MSLIQNYIITHQLQSIDVIVADKIGYGLLDHYIVYMGICEQGKHWFMGNMPQKGVHWVSEEEASALIQKYKPKRIRRFNGTDSQIEVAYQRALNLLDRDYDLIAYNCEHFANQVQFGKAESLQIQKAGMGLGFAALIGLGVAISRHPTGKGKKR